MLNVEINMIQEKIDGIEFEIGLKMQEISELKAQASKLKSAVKKLVSINDGIDE
jgi:hypothetical protein